MKTILAHLWHDLGEITQRKFRIAILEEFPLALAEHTAYIVG